MPDLGGTKVTNKQAQEVAIDTSHETVVVVIGGGDPSAPAEVKLLDSQFAAERLIEILMAGGRAPEDLRVFTGNEVRVHVTHQPVVSIVAKDGATVDHPAPRLLAHKEAAPEAAGNQLAARLLAHKNVSPPQQPKESSVPVPTFALSRLRPDRLIWAGVWVGAIVFLAAAMLITLSRPAPLEFAYQIDNTADGLTGDGGLAVLEETREPASGPLDPATPLIESAAPQTCGAGGIDDCQCSNFPTQADAQAFYERVAPRPGHIVDPDRNGLVCEGLPAYTPAPLTPVQ